MRKTQLLDFSFLKCLDVDYYSCISLIQDHEDETSILDICQERSYEIISGNRRVKILNFFKIMTSWSLSFHSGD